MTVFNIKGLFTGLLLLLPLLTFADAAVKDTKAVDSAVTKNWLKWGPYRPGLYFGVRPNVAETLLMGLMWGNGDDEETLLKSLRDTCAPDTTTSTTNDDNDISYSWTVYDPRKGGSQSLRDEALGVDLVTEFVKSEDGSGWAVRVTGEPDDHAANTTLVFHMAWEATNRGWSTSKEFKCGRVEGRRVAGAECRGNDAALGGEFEMRVNVDPVKNSIARWEVRSQRVSEKRIWKAKDIIVESGAFGSEKGEQNGGNMHFVRFDFNGPFTATLSFRDKKGLHTAPDVIIDQVDELQSSFESQLHRVFPMKAPFQDIGHTKFSQFLLSNLLGGLSFFHGESSAVVSHQARSGSADTGSVSKEVKTEAKTKAKPTSKAKAKDKSKGKYKDKAEVKVKDKSKDKSKSKAKSGAETLASKSQKSTSSLLSFTPSRSSFPHGFLWDEGFHLLPVMEWDVDLAIAVLCSWLNQMNSDGWIASEQILGLETSSRVPEQYQFQNPNVTSPPIFTAIVLPALLSKLVRGEHSVYRGHSSDYAHSISERTNLLREIYPKLAKHHENFRRSQAGDFSSTTAYPRPADAIPGEGYRWRTHAASGMDDYPREALPAAGDLHVDALAWAGASARGMQRLAAHLHETADAERYGAQVDAALHNLEALHWDDEAGMYCDASVEQQQYLHVCRVGYVGVMPLLVGLVDAAHPRLRELLATLAGERGGLWSAHGLRSQSGRYSLYWEGEGLWRGKVWMNMNVLAVLRLWEIGRQMGGGVASELAAGLRKNIVDTVYGQWLETGYVWQSYDDKTGAGNGAKGFTGWGSCLLMVLGLESGGEDVVDGTVDDGGWLGGDGMHTGLGGASRLSKQTVLVSVVGIMLMLALRRRIVRIGGRVAGYRRLGKGEIIGQKRVA